MRNKNFKLSIITPFYNEEAEGMIDNYFKKIIAELTPITNNWEIIAIDDGSADQSFEILKSYRLQDNRIKILKLSRNFGKEAALTAGLNYARGDIIIPLDADLQDPPALFADMITHWQAGYDVVVPIRVTRDDPLFKKLTASLFYWLCAKITNKNFIIKNAGDFRLMDKKVVTSINQLQEYHRFMKGLLTWPGYKKIYIEYHRPERKYGNSKCNYEQLFLHAIDGIFAFSIIPIRIIIFSGFILSIFTFLWGSFIIYEKLFLGISTPGYPSIMVAILFLGGIQITAIGIIGEYIGRIYNEVKKRPLYIIDENLS